MAAMLDASGRLFYWSAGRGAAPYSIAPVGGAVNGGTSGGGGSGGRGGGVRAAPPLTCCFGTHPMALWVAGRGAAYRVDLREPPRPDAV
ncbi:unnamed protein product, partial [Phaeothamnion confervicola]